MRIVLNMCQWVQCISSHLIWAICKVYGYVWILLRNRTLNEMSEKFAWVGLTSRLRLLAKCRWDLGKMIHGIFVPVLWVSEHPMEMLYKAMRRNRPRLLSIKMDIFCVTFRLDMRPREYNHSYGSNNTTFEILVPRQCGKQTDQFLLSISWR